MTQISFQKVKPRVHVADLSTRTLAFILDFLLLMLTIGIIEYFTVSSNEQAWLFKGERLLHLLLGCLYFAGSESSAWQGSIGKIVLGLRVTGMAEERISFRCATLRYFLKPVSIFVFLTRFISGTHPLHVQLFHDRVARTRVLTET